MWKLKLSLTIGFFLFFFFFFWGGGGGGGLVDRFFFFFFVGRIVLEKKGRGYASLDLKCIMQESTIV
jgi:hypothetical protein